MKLAKRSLGILLVLAVVLSAFLLMAFTSSADVEDDVAELKLRVEYLENAGYLDETAAAAIFAELSDLGDYLKKTDAADTYATKAALDTLSNTLDTLSGTLDALKDSLGSFCDATEIEGAITAAISNALSNALGGGGDIATAISNAVTALEEGKVDAALSNITTLTNELVALSGIIDDLTDRIEALETMKTNLGTYVSKEAIDTAITQAITDALATGGSIANAIKTVSDALAALADRVAALEQLKTDLGVYVSDDVIDGAIATAIGNLKDGDLKAAVERITALETSLTALAGRVTALETAIGEFTAAAYLTDKQTLQAAIDGIAANLATEITNRIDADEDLQDAIDDANDEIDALQTALTELTNNFNTLKAAFETFTTSTYLTDKQTLEDAIQDVADDLAQEILDRIDADEDLQDAIDDANDEIDALTSSLTTLTDNFNTLKSTVDTFLNTTYPADKDAQAQINTALQEAINGVAANLATEITNRTNADATLQGAIDAACGRITALETALTTLTNNFNTLKGTVDTFLNTTYPADKDAQAAINTALQAAIDQEIANRITGDAELLNTLNATIARVTTLETSLTTLTNNFNALKSTVDTFLNTTYPSDKQAQAAINTALQAAINQEIQDRIAGDADLLNTLNATIARVTECEAKIVNLETAVAALNKAAEGFLGADDPTIQEWVNEQIEIAFREFIEGPFQAALDRITKAETNISGLRTAVTTLRQRVNAVEADYLTSEDKQEVSLALLAAKAALEEKIANDIAAAIAAFKNEDFEEAAEKIEATEEEVAALDNSLQTLTDKMENLKSDCATKEEQQALENQVALDIANAINDFANGEFKSAVDRIKMAENDIKLLRSDLADNTDRMNTQQTLIVVTMIVAGVEAIGLALALVKAFKKK